MKLGQSGKSVVGVVIFQEFCELRGDQNQITEDVEDLQGKHWCFGVTERWREVERYCFFWGGGLKDGSTEFRRVKICGLF